MRSQRWWAAQGGPPGVAADARDVVWVRPPCRGGHIRERASLRVVERPWLDGNSVRPRRRQARWPLRCSRNYWRCRPVRARRACGSSHWLGVSSSRVVRGAPCRGHPLEERDIARVRDGRLSERGLDLPAGGVSWEAWHDPRQGHELYRAARIEPVFFWQGWRVSFRFPGCHACVQAVAQMVQNWARAVIAVCSCSCVCSGVPCWCPGIFTRKGWEFVRRGAELMRDFLERAFLERWQNVSWRRFDLLRTHWLRTDGRDSRVGYDEIHAKARTRWQRKGAPCDGVQCALVRRGVRASVRCICGVRHGLAHPVLHGRCQPAVARRARRGLPRVSVASEHCAVRSGVRIRHGFLQSPSRILSWWRSICWRNTLIPLSLLLCWSAR